MEIKKIIHSFAVVPFLAANLTFPSLPVAAIPSATAALSNISFLESDENAEAKQLEAARADKAAKIDAYFEKRDMPLAGHGMKLVTEAEKYGLEWSLLAAIAVRESTGGKFACKYKPNNPFGWGSCKIGFETMDLAIETIAKNLGGENPNTARYYDGKTTEEILAAYNPPSIVPEYVPQVVAIMTAIDQGK